MLKKIISGGQTGVDRGALEAALAAGFPCGGWCPSGRRAEDGEIPERYPLRETVRSDYEHRTEKNVLDSDGTLIIAEGELSGGTALTRELARKHDRPCLVVDINLTFEENIRKIRDWIEFYKLETLNVAGPRESKKPGIGNYSRGLITELLSPDGR